MLAGHAPQTPPVHASVGAHVLPHVPQFLGSVLRSVQVVPHLSGQAPVSVGVVSVPIVSMPVVSVPIVSVPLVSVMLESVPGSVGVSVVDPPQAAIKAETPTRQPSARIR